MIWSETRLLKKNEETNWTHLYPEDALCIKCRKKRLLQTIYGPMAMMFVAEVADNNQSKSEGKEWPKKLISNAQRGNFTEKY